MTRDPITFLGAQRAALGPVFTLRVFPFRAGLVCAVDAELNREVLTDQERFVGGDAAWLLEPIVGPRSLILTPPPTHLRNRKLLLPSFHGERVALWGERVREVVLRDLPSLVTGEPVAVRPWAQRLTLDVILRVIFGLTDPVSVEAFRSAIDRLAARSMQALLFAPTVLRRDLGPGSPGGMLARRRAAVDALIADQIASRRAAQGDSADDDVLSVLLGSRDETGKGFSDPELFDELVGLVAAGHETTATALAWTLHLLAHNPFCRDKLLAELDDGGEDLLRAVIKESLRLRPPVLDAVRTASGDTQLGGHPVPKDAFVSAMFCVTHQDPSLWAEPHRFRPERHLDGDSEPYSWTPFGGGVRRCIGASLVQLELEIVLREALRVAVPEPAGTSEPVRLHGVTLIPARGGRVRMRPRRA